MQINTFSIVAYDPEARAWGIGVASKFLAAQAVVSWARADAGAVATQSYARVGFGPRGLDLMESGKSAEETLAALLADDNQRESRQVGLVDKNGQAAAHTGKKCHEWAGHRIGEGFAVQGNILVGVETVNAMAEAYQSATGELADRLLTALIAGDSAGGDRRGKQSAGVLVVKAGAGYGGDNDRYLDLRVDDDEKPLNKLRDLIQMHHLFFGKPNPKDQIKITPEIARKLQKMMLNEGYIGGEITDQWDEMTRQAFFVMVGNENLEERWSLQNDPRTIDRIALEYLRRKFNT